MSVDKSKCLICEAPCPQKGLSFFRFPEDQRRLNLWFQRISPLLDILKADPNNVKENGRICARHFKERDFTSRKKTSLMLTACPGLGISNLDGNSKKDKNDRFIRKIENNDKNDRFIRKIENNDRFMRKIENNEMISTEKNVLKSKDGNDADIFQCGKCKNQFEILSQFIAHKRYPCQPAIAKSVRREHSQPNGLPLLENAFINSSHNQLGTAEQENKSSEQIIEIIREQPPCDRVVSLIIDKDKFLVDYPVNIAALPNQVLSTPSICDGKVAKSGHSSSTDLSLADQVIVFPQTPIHSSYNLVSNRTESSFIITTGEGIVYTCPVQNISNDVVMSPPSATDQVILPAEMADPAKKEVGVGDRILYCELTSVLNASPGMLNEKEKVEEKEVSRNEESEHDEMKTGLACSFCKKVFKKAFNLQQHERIHTGERPFQCIICGRAFKQKSNVMKHMLRHRVWPKPRQTLKQMAQNKEGGGESAGEIDYSCQYCPLRFKSYPEHKKHMAVHSDMKVYRCIQKDCKETFVDLDEFLFHSTMHSSAEFQCHICLKTFTNLTELGVHQYDHSTAEKEKTKKSDISRKLRCKVCNARFKSTESFHNHLAVDTHRYECYLCQRVFSTERFLRRHLHNHKNHLRFRCQDCAKTFPTKQNLRNHAFVHLKEKPYTCDHCDKQFGFRSRLRRHLASHLNEYLECPFKKHLGCDKTFYRKDKLRDHVSTHSHSKIRFYRMGLKSCRPPPPTLQQRQQRQQQQKQQQQQRQEQQHHLKRDHKSIMKCFVCSQIFRKNKELMEHPCGGEKAEKGEEEMKEEAVSNIEIIMMPFGTGGRDIP